VNEQDLESIGKKMDIETELRGKITNLELRNLELVTKLDKHNSQLEKRFTDEQIVRFLKIMDETQSRRNDYY
jgi:hypothetical protein